MEDLWIFGVTRSIWSTVSGIQRNLFGTGMEDHHNVADLFQMVRTHGKWGCGNMVPPCYHLVPLSSARFCLQWCPWWEVTVVLPSIGVLETFAHQDGANGKISSPMVWWRQWFAFNRRFGSFGEIFSWPLSKWEDFITIDLVTSTFRNAFIEIQAGTIHAQELELCVLVGMKSEDCRHRYFREPEVRVFRSRLFGKLCNEDCGVCLRLVVFYHRWMLEEQTRKFGSFSRTRESLFLHENMFEREFFSETNRKKTTCTNQFSMCLSKRQF